MQKQIKYNASKQLKKINTKNKGPKYIHTVHLSHWHTNEQNKQINKQTLTYKQMQQTNLIFVCCICLYGSVVI